MTFPVTLKSKNPYVSDETWTQMVSAAMAELSQVDFSEKDVNPVYLAEAKVEETLDLLFSQAPPEKDPYSYVDWEYGKPDEEITKDEVLAIRSMRDEGISEAQICEILQLSKRLVHGAAVGKIYPCIGGRLHTPGKLGLTSIMWHTNLERMRGAVLAEAMTYLPPDLFDLLCRQNGLELTAAFDAVNTVEDRNDEEDRHFYRSFLRRLLREETPKPAQFESNQGGSGRGRKRKVRA